MQDLYEDYQEAGKASINKQLEDLTPEQINKLAEELNKKIRTEKEGEIYQLNPELDLGVAQS